MGKKFQRKKEEGETKRNLKKLKNLPDSTVIHLQKWNSKIK